MTGGVHITGDLFYTYNNDLGSHCFGGVEITRYTCAKTIRVGVLSTRPRLA